MTSTMTFDEAKALRTAYETDLRLLGRKPKHELVAIETSEQAAIGVQHVFGGPSTKEEYLRSILDLRFPPARLNETTHVLYHGPATTSSACEWCRCQVTWRYREDGRSYDYLAQCTGQPGHDGDHQDREHPEAGISPARAA